MNIANLLLNAAASFARQPALCLGSRVVSNYTEFCQRASRIAGGLKSQYALAPGDRVAIVMTNVPEYLPVLFGIWWAGLVAVPVNARLHAREVEYILENSGARLCFVNSDTEGTLAGMQSSPACLNAVVSVRDPGFGSLAESEGVGLVPRSPTDPAWLFFTSGTTGHPKAATLTHLNLLMMSLAYLADIQPATFEHAIFHAAPMSHGTGLLAIPHVAKASANVVLESRSMNHDEIFGLLGTYRNVTMYHTPTMLKRMVNHPGLASARLDNLDCVFYGGSPMYTADLLMAIDRLGPRLTQMWAQAETPNTGTYLSKRHHMDRTHPRYMERIASAGISRTGVEIRVADPDDKTVPTGELGEVLVRGPVVMAGYWQSPEANAQTLRNGWLHTGDIGSMDADGFLSIKDRAKDMIISGGFNIYPREIEEVLLRHPDVLEAAVLGRPHDDLVEEVVACVVKRPNSTLCEADLDALCLDNIARFKRPREYFFLDELPKGFYGKIQKRDMRDLVRKRETRAPS